MKKLANKI